MGKPSRASMAKRNRERDQKEKQMVKEQERVARRENRKQRAQQREDGEDPDLIGIVAGPQPPRED